MAWTPRGSLKGATGEQGTQGLPGPTGATGSQGQQGAQGPQGVPGAQGSTGQQGQQGVAGAQGSVGSQGPSGATGPTGDRGPIGPKGDKGDTGAAGVTGDRGPAGTNGINGTNGSSGSNGTNGTNGVDGNTILATTGAPAASLGRNGDYALDIAAANLYGPKAAGAWPSTPRNLVGAAGSGGGAAQMSSGPGGPTGVGTKDNYFFNTTTNVLYRGSGTTTWNVVAARTVGFVQHTATDDSVAVLDFMQSNGIVSASMHAMGRLVLGGPSGFENSVGGAVKLAAISGGTSTTPIVARGVSGQTANLTEWQDGGGNNLAWVDQIGNFTARSLTASTGRIKSTADVTATSTAHPLQIGDSGGANLRMDSNEILAVDNGQPSILTIGLDDADLNLGGSRLKIAKYADDSTLLRTNRTGFNTAVKLAPAQVRSTNAAGTSYVPHWASSFDVASSEEVKENLEPLPYSALDAVTAAPVSRWSYSSEITEGSEDNVHVGPMAEALPPEVTRAVNDPDEPTRVSLSSMIGLLWGAVQELTEKVTDLETQLASRQ